MDVWVTWIIKDIWNINLLCGRTVGWTVKCSMKTLPIMIRKFKQWWSIIPPIWTKWTITFQLKSLNRQRKEKTATSHGVRLQDASLWYTHKCAWLNRLIGPQPSHLNNWIPYAKTAKCLLIFDLFGFMLTHVGEGSRLYIPDCPICFL